jgi:hypothetical protein
MDTLSDNLEIKTPEALDEWMAYKSPDFGTNSKISNGFG